MYGANHAISLQGAQVVAYLGNAAFTGCFQGPLYSQIVLDSLVLPLGAGGSVMVAANAGIILSYAQFRHGRMGGFGNIVGHARNVWFLSASFALFCLLGFVSLPYYRS